jgi:hypothetical protein
VRSIQVVVKSKPVSHADDFSAVLHMQSWPGLLKYFEEAKLKKSEGLAEDL